MKSDQSSTRATVRRIKNERLTVVEQDALATEEPLEIRIGFQENGKPTHKSISITMRTPGGENQTGNQEDFELAAGFLFTEGIISSARQIQKIHHCGKPLASGLRNTVRVDLSPGTTIDFKKLERHFYTSSSCGVCGKSSIEALHTGVQRLTELERPIFAAGLIHRLPETLRQAQNVFDRTGGLHAAALFDKAGKLQALREDVGRHNAVDKLIGSQMLINQVPLADSLLFVSGRASFELVQKALMAGIPILAAVGAPSSLAVELAKTFGMTLLGFVRDERFNIYSNPRRISVSESEIPNPADLELTGDHVSRAKTALTI